MMESSDFLCWTGSSIKRSGLPTPMNLPTMTVVPLGNIATASSAETTFMGEFDLTFTIEANTHFPWNVGQDSISG